MTNRVWTGLLATMVAGTASAQQPVINVKLAEAQPAKYTPPLCPLKSGGGKVDKGVDALKKSFEAKTPADKQASLQLANQLLTEGITKENQAGNAAAWYYLGRVYIQQGDVGGIDSAFTKAQALAPSCELDIGQYRQNNWALLANKGLELQKQGDTEGALNLFRDASRFFTGLPHVLSNMGVLFANTGREDSAAIYFAKSLAVAEKDTALVEDRNATALNLALMYQRTNKHPQAIAALHKYLGWDPKNNDAKKALAESFRAAGMADSANALEGAMIGELAKKNLDSLDTGDLLNVGVAAFNAKKYPEAASAFGKAMARNPWSRDAVYNVANTYLAMQDNAKLVEAANQLVAIEPLNEDAYRLLGQAHRGLKHEAETLKAAEKLVGLPVHVEVTSFQMGKSSARLQGTATGRSPSDAQGKPVKAGPVTVVFEFVTASGQAVDSKEVALPKLDAGATQAINVEGKGEGIAGWRYKVK
ncbi:MAG: hypothetical protein ABI647_05885 [Gemmatimonadota bacterium]